MSDNCLLDQDALWRGGGGGYFQRSSSSQGEHRDTGGC